VKGSVLKSEDYERIEASVKLTGQEDFVVCVHKRHNKLSFSIHVFERQPMTQEVLAYEETASKMKFRGTKAEMDGSQVLASSNLYNKLIARVYDLPVGRVVHDQLDRAAAVQLVPVLVKREAIRDFVGGVISANQLAENEGTEAEMTAPRD